MRVRTTIIIVVLVFLILGSYLIYRDSIAKHCYEYALLESVSTINTHDFPNTADRASRQSRLSEDLFRICLESNSIQPFTSFQEFGD